MLGLQVLESPVSQSWFVSSSHTDRKKQTEVWTVDLDDEMRWCVWSVVNPVDHCGVTHLLRQAANEEENVCVCVLACVGLLMGRHPPKTNVCIFHNAHHHQSDLFPLPLPLSVTHGWKEGDVRLFSPLCDHSGVYSDEMRSVSQHAAGLTRHLV